MGSAVENTLGNTETIKQSSRPFERSPFSGKFMLPPKTTKPICVVHFTWRFHGMIQSNCRINNLNMFTVWRMTI